MRLSVKSEQGQGKSKSPRPKSPQIIGRGSTAQKRNLLEPSKLTNTTSCISDFDDNPVNLSSFKPTNMLLEMQQFTEAQNRLSQLKRTMQSDSEVSESSED